MGLSSVPPCTLDADREARLDLEAGSQLLTGRAHRIDIAGQGSFQVIASEPRVGRPTVLLLPGPGRSAIDRLSEQLMITLNERGYGIAAAQMPVQRRECESFETYPQTFALAFSRIDATLKWLAGSGQTRVVLFGAWLADAFVAARPGVRLHAWIVPNLTGGFSRFDQPGLRILDVYGERANAMTLNAADRRRATLERFPASRQVRIAGADMEFSGRYDELAQLIDNFLASLG